MRKSIFAIVGVMLYVAAPSAAMAESNVSYEADDVYRGTSTTGLTGLYHTVSPYTSGTGISATAYGVITPTPGGSTLITPVSANIGLGKGFELSAVTRLYSAPGITATGDTDFYAKYKFRSLRETVPSMALALGVTLPTATNAAAEDVTALSGHVLVIMGGEVNVAEDWVVGLYANFGAHFIDPSAASQNNYSSINLGMMVPISDDQHLQGFAEYRDNTGKAAATVSGAPGRDYVLGLRFATRFLKITGGIEKGDGAANTTVFGGLTLEI